MIKILASRNQFWVEMDLVVLDLAPPIPQAVGMEKRMGKVREESLNAGGGACAF